MKTRTTYSITTEERTYSYVISREKFADIRKTWSDYSKVTRAFVFTTGDKGWTKIDATGW